MPDQPGFPRFLQLVRVLVTFALLTTSVGNALLGYAREPYVWAPARGVNLTYAIVETLIAIGLIVGLTFLLRNRPLPPLLRKVAPWFWAGATFTWLTTVLWTALAEHVTLAIRIADAMDALAISLIFAMCWRVSIRDRDAVIV